MKLYKDVISLSKNERGIWDLDTIKGCESGLKFNERGCYGDCYAAKTALRYGINFSKSIERKFVNQLHVKQIVNKIEKIDMPFIRIGCSGDPSENWEHTLNVIEKLKHKNQLSLFDVSSKKEIVIITRHWKHLSDEQLNKLKKFNVCINTSVSALDDYNLLNNSLTQYKRIKPYCKSILRVVTCKFNLKNHIGFKMNQIQDKLISEIGFIDTVFRPSKNNFFVVNNIIEVQKLRFIKSKQLVSKNNRKAFLGKCKSCIEMCGINK